MRLARALLTLLLIGCGSNPSNGDGGNDLAAQGGDMAGCGQLGTPCCGTTCSAGQCIGGLCRNCGSLGSACCPGGGCAAGAACNNGVCAACGAPGDACCPATACGTGCCANNVCVGSGSSCGNLGG